MPRKYTGPKREDGRLIYKSGVIEQRAYLEPDEDGGGVQFWTFVGDDPRGENVNNLGPLQWDGIKQWVRELDRGAK